MGIENDEDQNVYEVEKIVAHERINGGYMYLVKWKGYSSDENTWEPMEHLEHCRNIISDHWIEWKRSNGKLRKNSLSLSSSQSPEPREHMIMEGAMPNNTKNNTFARRANNISRSEVQGAITQPKENGFAAKKQNIITQAVDNGSRLKSNNKVIFPKDSGIKPKAQDRVIFPVDSGIRLNNHPPKNSGFGMISKIRHLSIKKHNTVPHKKISMRPNPNKTPKENSLPSLINRHTDVSRSESESNSPYRPEPKRLKLHHTFDLGSDDPELKTALGDYMPKPLNAINKNRKQKYGHFKSSSLGQKYNSRSMAQPYVSDSILSTPNIGNSSSPILVDSEIDSSDDEPLIQIHNEAKTKNLSPKASGYAKNDEPPDSFESTTVLSSGKVLPPNVLEFYKILKGAKGPPITVVNNVDNEGPPPNFTYIDDNIWSPDVPQPSREAVCGCECSDGQSCFVPDPDNGTIESECLCMDLQSSVMPYDSNGLLITESGSSIYECNHMCSCGPDCHMRVVQKGRTVPLRIFKSKNRGWGVDAMTLIKKGQFICEYVGEIITYIEAEHRLSSEVELGTSYLFDLDSEVQEHEFSDFTIDARHYGNISRFINHSCEPNIEIRAVFIEHWDKRLHRLALFARRDIMPGEELAFDYNPGRKFIDSDSDLNHSENLVHKNNMPRSGQKASTTIPKHFICYCGTASCRGKIFT